MDPKALDHPECVTPEEIPGNSSFSDFEDESLSRVIEKILYTKLVKFNFYFPSINNLRLICKHYLKVILFVKQILLTKIMPGIRFPFT